ncbi:class I SAM-dependent methyltransferase [Asticcacaulis sp. DW145]|uniref:class I SAM-dependent methyltransferase n=1 Tax=unclassified Asticcacaulis TaxID=2628350 RepID=UPI00308C5E83|nr:class I SAM-dependent methyltransferase [Asticcacaulis sp. DW145]
MQTRDFNQEAKSLTDKKYNYDFDGIVRQYMMRAFEPFFVPGPALELGCYEGDSTLELVRYFDDLTVVEASSEALDVARSRVQGHVRFIQSVFEDLEPGQLYDTIFLINTLEHVDNAVEVLARIRDWLTPKGRLFVLVPNADAPSRQIAVYMGLITHNNAVTPGEWTHGHRRTYSFDTLNSDLRDAGLSVLHAGGILFKGLANFQMDKALEAGIIDMNYIEGCYKLGQIQPTLCSSIFAVCTR